MACNCTLVSTTFLCLCRYQRLRAAARALRWDRRCEGVILATNSSEVHTFEAQEEIVQQEDQKARAHTQY